MQAIRRAVWFIEAHFAEPIGLDEIAAVAGLSRFHFSRLFAQVAGLPVSAYLRGRRLTVAARRLAAGAPDILQLALEVGYGSHEAFTRAFRDAFGLTPEAARARRDPTRLPLTEILVMPDTPPPTLPPPNVREEGPMLLAGLRAFRAFDDRAGIPAQWQAFGPHIGHIPGERGDGTWGACLAPADGREGFDYLTAVAVRSLDDLPEGLTGARLARRRYAVFPHIGHVSAIGETCAAIFNHWAPASGEILESEPLFLLERYGPGFDPRTGLGEMEVWLPLK